MSNTNLVELPILGRQTADLGDGRVVDLKDYLKYSPREVEGATFKYYKFLDIQNFDTDSYEFKQMSIRQEQIIWENVEQIKTNVQVEGWDTSEFIPVMDENDVIQFGHHRLLALKNLGMKYMPIAVYDYGDLDEDDRADIALLDNDREKPREPAKRDDYIKRGLTRVLNGNLKNIDTEIESWLLNKMKLNRKFSKGSITYMVNNIQKRAELGGELNVYHQKREQWVQFCEEANRPIGKDRPLIKMDKITYAWRALCSHVLKENVRTSPVEIVLYSELSDAVDVRNALDRFTKEIDRLYKGMYDLVDPTKYAPDGVTVEAPSVKNRMYKLVCVPQIVGSHDKQIEKNCLIPVDKY